MSGITCHVLDTARGRPAAGIAVALCRLGGDSWQALASATTDTDGRVRQWDAEVSPSPGTFRVRFDTGPYLLSQDPGTAPFYPYVDVVFSLADASEHYHIPLLLSPFGYSTYRGS